MTVHLAAAPDIAAGLQVCGRCGEILTDQRGVHSVDGHGLHWWVTGTLIELSPGHMMVTTDPPNCPVRRDG